MIIRIVKSWCLYPAKKDFKSIFETSQFFFQSFSFTARNFNYDRIVILLEIDSIPIGVKSSLHFSSLWQFTLFLVISCSKGCDKIVADYLSGENWRDWNSFCERILILRVWEHEQEPTCNDLLLYFLILFCCFYLFHVWSDH